MTSSDSRSPCSRSPTRPPGCRNWRRKSLTSRILEHVGTDVDSWGLGHGTWSVLLHAFPAADIPVAQLSINATKPPEYHLRLGMRLAGLREPGILVMGSGDVVHNLRAIDWSRPDGAFEWAKRFDDRARQMMSERPADVAALMKEPGFEVVAPPPEHFLPLLYIAGLAAPTDKSANVLVDGYAYGSLSMTSCTVGMRCPDAGENLDGAAPLATDLPPEDANV